MKPTIIMSALASLLLGPALALANCGESKCGNPCEKKVECPKPCEKKVKCCEKVKVCVPVEKTHCRLVKTTCCEPKTHTKCVKDKCNPCAPPQQITWTTYHKKTKCHWERYTTTEYKTKTVKRCSEHVVTASNGGAIQTVALAN